MASTSVFLITALVWIGACWVVAIPQQRIAAREVSPEDWLRAFTNYRWVLAKTARGRRAARLALLAYLAAVAGGLGLAVVSGTAAREERERPGVIVP